jgi:hypothetical protein
VNDLQLQILDVCLQQMNFTVLSKILKRKEENRLFHIVLPYDIMGKIMDKAMKEKIKKYKIKHIALPYDIMGKS